MNLVLYPMQVVCGACGTVLLISWYSPFGPGSGEPIYKHPERHGCEFDGKKLKSTGLPAEVIEEEQ